MNSDKKRQAVVEKYKILLGRNRYSQKKRDYCYKKHSDGHYYSDCSSSVSYAYKEAGHSFGILNTVGMYQSAKLTDVPVVIENGIIQNPEILRPGDLLLFAGTDTSRAQAGYVGHVEMVYKISGKTITLCGHGSGTPRTTEMNAYCKSRYVKSANTKLGHRGLIRVRRFIQDEAPGPRVRITGGSVNIRSGPGTSYPVLGLTHRNDTHPAPATAGWLPIVHENRVAWVSGKYALEEANP